MSTVYLIVDGTGEKSNKKVFLFCFFVSLTGKKSIRSTLRYRSLGCSLFFLYYGLVLSTQSVLVHMWLVSLIYFLHSWHSLLYFSLHLEKIFVWEEITYSRGILSYGVTFISFEIFFFLVCVLK